MAYVSVPKDLTKVKTKVALNLTKRQLIGFALAGAIGFSVYLLSRNFFPNDLSMLLMITAALIHCFSQSVEMMEEYVKMGDYLALGGAVTFKNAKTPKEVAKKVPLDRLLLETDCPYMTPVPYRGKRNEPKLVKFVCQYIADLRQIDSEEVEKITAENTKRFFGI